MAHQHQLRYEREWYIFDSGPSVLLALGNNEQMNRPNVTLAAALTDRPLQTRPYVPTRLIDRQDRTTASLFVRCDWVHTTAAALRFPPPGILSVHGVASS
jgi:hypothetical protein